MIQLLLLRLLITSSIALAFAAAALSLSPVVHRGIDQPATAHHPSIHPSWLAVMRELSRAPTIHLPCSLALSLVRFSYSLPYSSQSEEGLLSRTTSYSFLPLQSNDSFHRIDSHVAR
jgi:hypothetical protein